MRVFKFGGASVKDSDAVKNVASVLQDYGQGPLLVVISAMGKITNKLEELVDAYYFSCLLYTSPSPRDRTRSRMPSSA